MITKPKGTYDVYGNNSKVYKYLSNLFDNVCQSYNYKYIRTPIFESSDVFHRTVGNTSDIVTKETYDFKDRGERNLTLRPEGTAGIVRSFIENKMYANNLPVKLYYFGTMYRYERPQSGRNREFTQFGVEVLGSDDQAIDAEVISLPYNILTSLGINNIKVKINSLGDLESKEAYRQALVNYFADKINNMCPDCQARFQKNPLRILDCKVDNNSDIMKNVPNMCDYLSTQAKENFSNLLNYLDILNIEYEIDQKLVRGLDYYSDVVFELVSDIKELGSGNVLAAGGRYNNLVNLLDGPATPGIGFALGLERLILALEYQEIILPIDDKIDAYLMYVSQPEKEKAIKINNDLRINGFKTEMEYMDRSLKNQFKQADKLNARCYIILNDENLKDNEVQVKASKTKKEEIINIDYLTYYLEEIIEDNFEEIENEEDLY